MNPTIDNPRLLRGRHPCDECGSSDSLGYYEDHKHCYGACDKTWFYDNEGKKGMREEEPIDFDEVINTCKAVQELPIRGVKERDLPMDVMEFYGVHTEINNDGSLGSRYYPWYQDGELTTYKQKTLDKKFFLQGDTRVLNRPKTELFGQHLFKGGQKTLVITEGEDDCLAMQRAYMKKYKRQFPVVSVFNSNDTSTVVKNLEWINSFEKVILWGDHDKNDAGKKLMDQIAKIIGPAKAHLVSETKHKDANDALIAEGYEYLISAVWNALPYQPAGFVRGEELWSKFQERKDVETLEYPKSLSGLNTKLKGMRKGEIVLFVSGTGSGKTTVTKEIMLEIIADESQSLGIISLEEDVGETVQKLIEMWIGKDVDSDNPPSVDEQRAAFDYLFGHGRVIVLDHQGSVSDDSLVDKMRALCAMGITNIILDHITIAVSEGTNDGLTGNEAIDKMMSDLLKLVKGWPVWLGVISHLRKTGAGGKSFEEGHMPSMDDIKGSGSIKQICFDIIGFSRDMTHENEKERNTISIMVLKARRTGKTGPAGRAFYDGKTKRLTRIADTSAEAAEDLFSNVSNDDSRSVSKAEALERMGL